MTIHDTRPEGVKSAGTPYCFQELERVWWAAECLRVRQARVYRNNKVVSDRERTVGCLVDGKLISSRGMSIFEILNLLKELWG